MTTLILETEPLATQIEVTDEKLIVNLVVCQFSICG